MIRTESVDGIRTLVLEHGKANALDLSFMTALTEELAEAANAGPPGVVLTSEGNIFCAGLDIVSLLELDRPGMQTMLDALYEVCRALFAFPRPAVAALNGHTIAGGAVLSLGCDHRIMAQGDAKWGLSESALGLSLPAYAVEMLRYALSRGVVEKLVYTGAVYPAFKAHDMGVLDQLVESENLLEEAYDWITSSTQSLPAFADLKQRLRAPTLEAMERSRRYDDDWLDLWFSDDTQARLTAARDRLTQKEPPSS